MVHLPKRWKLLFKASSQTCCVNKGSQGHEKRRDSFEKKNLLIHLNLCKLEKQEAPNLFMKGFIMGFISVMTSQRIVIM